jgi:putative heme utilization carrier protein HutX
MRVNQPSQQADRIRAAVEKNPRKMTLQLARDLGVPEVEVIRAIPADRVTELDNARWEELLRSLETLGSVRVLVSNGAATIEVDGQFGGFSTTGEFFNVQTDTLDMHIRWRQLAAVFAVEKPGHMDGTATRGFQFFDQTGAAAFKILAGLRHPARHVTGWLRAGALGPTATAARNASAGGSTEPTTTARGGTGTGGGLGLGSTSC